MEAMAQSAYSGPITMTDASDMAVPLHPATSGQSHFSSTTNHTLCREWPAWDSQMPPSLYAHHNTCDTLGSLQWADTEGDSTFGAASQASNDAIARWPSQTSSWPVYHQQDQSAPSTGFSTQGQWPASATPLSSAMSSAWEPRPETRLQNQANTVSTRSKGTRTRPSSSSSTTLRKAPKKTRVGSHGESSPATSTDDSVHLIDDSGDDVDRKAHPLVRPRVEKGKTTYRAKNRVAAKRCREKTKQYEIDLANKEKAVTQERMYLDACVTALKNEVLTLKNQILQHSDCDCDVIQGYIARAASGISISAARVP